jgi:chromate transporter
MATSLLIFLRLGLTSFGGPVAHLGYFRREFVERQRWLSEEEFGQLVAISQFLPGPGSSQLSFATGLLRGGWLGALAAFVGFTLPSALLLFIFAGSLRYLEGPVGQAAIQGLKIVALAVVTHGVLGMLKKLCPDAVRKTIAVVVAVAILLSGSAWMQLVMVAVGGLAGFWFCREERLRLGELPALGFGRATAVALLVIFGALLLLSFWPGNGIGSVAGAFYQAGALVFGGGHVVLPLLEESVVAPGWVTEKDFLAGYGAAQAIPGPMFAFSAYLGAVLPVEMGGGWLGSLVAVLAIFLPGMLLMSAFLPLWKKVSRYPKSAWMVAGVNAAVVGLLGAALYDPIFVSAVGQATDLAIALVALLMLSVWHRSPLLVVLWCVGARVLVGLL